MSEPSTPAVAYMERTRKYYEAQGFEQAYRYAHHTQTPFARPIKALADSRIGLVTTASTYYREELEPRKVHSGYTTPTPERLYTNDLSWHKEATHTNDVNSFCPIDPLHRLVDMGVIKALAPRFHCVPTEYSHRATAEHDAPEILRRLKEDEADVALLVPL